MDTWILQAIALLLTAPWWLAVARHVIRAVQDASRPGTSGAGHEPNRNAFERARDPWGRSDAEDLRVPRRLANRTWSTGRRIASGIPRGVQTTDTEDPVSTQVGFHDGPREMPDAYSEARARLGSPGRTGYRN